MTVSSTSSAGASTLARFAPLAFAILQVLTPLLPQMGIGEPIGDRSDGVRTLITPAGWAFSIWGLLYAGSFLFAIYQALPAQRDNALVAAVRWPASGAFLGNAAWAAYTQVYGLTAISVAIILFTLACLMTVYVRFARWPRSFTPGERWCVVLPLSALAAWLTAASIVNISATLLYYDVNLGASVPLLGAAVIIVGGLIAATLVYGGYGNLAYAAVFLWALSAIYAAGGQRADMIGWAAIASALLVIAAAVLGLRRSTRRSFA